MAILKKWLPTYEINKKKLENIFHFIFFFFFSWHYFRPSLLKDMTADPENNPDPAESKSTTLQLNGQFCIFFLLNSFSMY